MQLSNRNCPYSKVFCSQTESFCVLPHPKTTYDLLRYFSITSCIQKVWEVFCIYRNISLWTCIVAKMTSDY